MVVASISISNVQFCYEIYFTTNQNSFVVTIILAQVGKTAFNKVFFAHKNKELLQYLGTQKMLRHKN